MDDIYNDLFKLYEYYHMYKCYDHQDSSTFRERINDCSKLILEIEKELQRASKLKNKVEIAKQNLEKKKSFIKILHKKLERFESIDKEENEVLEDLVK